MSCINCPSCQSESSVYSFKDVGPNVFMRRRKCRQCGAFWSTYEISTTELHEIRRRTRRTIDKTEALVAELDRFLVQLGEPPHSNGEDLAEAKNEQQNAT